MSALHLSDTEKLGLSKKHYLRRNMQISVLIINPILKRSKKLPWLMKMRSI